MPKNGKAGQDKTGQDKAGQEKPQHHNINERKERENLWCCAFSCPTWPYPVLSCPALSFFGIILPV
jgi:hypothetical protein